MVHSDLSSRDMQMKIAQAIELSRPDLSQQRE